MEVNNMAKIQKISKAALDNILLPMKLVWSANAWLMLLVVGGALASGLIPGWRTVLMKTLIDTALEAHAKHKDLRPVIGQVLLSVVVWVLDQALTISVTAARQLLQQQTANQVTLRVMKKATDLDLAQVETPEVRDVLRLASTNAQFAPVSLVADLAFAVKHLVAICSLGVILGQVGAWFVPVGLIIAIAPSSIARTFFGWVGYWTMRLNTPQLRQMSYLFEVLTSVEYFIEVRLYNLTAFLTGWFQKIRDDLDQAVWKTTRKNLAAQFCLGILWHVASGVAYLYAVYRILSGQISAGELAQYFTLMALFQDNISGVLEAIVRIVESSLFAKAVFDLEKYQPRIVSPSLAQPIEPAPTAGLEIEFQGVSFAYEPGKFVLKDLSFIMRPGTSTALVGLNGAGKTTLVKLLMRFYDPTDGVILVNGRDIRTYYDLNDLRGQISAVVQNFNLFNFSMAENIGLGNLSERENRSLIEEAGRRSHIHSVITALPNGYETLYGETFKIENGPTSTRLSGGQQQLLALARCLVRPAGLLILDEWTASLDPIAVAKLLKDFDEATQATPVTQLLISHTLSVAKNCSQILVLEDGTIREQGTHADLMELGGVYAYLFKLQADQYV